VSSLLELCEEAGGESGLCDAAGRGPEFWSWQGEIAMSHPLGQGALPRSFPALPRIKIGLLDAYIEREQRASVRGAPARAPQGLLVWRALVVSRRCAPHR